MEGVDPATFASILPGGGGLTPGITVVILARNEARRIEAAIACTRGWASAVIVVDNESTDDTAAIARRCGALVVSAPRALRFDALRMAAMPLVRTPWVHFLDADERVPPALGQRLAAWAAAQPEEVAAGMLPFRNHFCGRWIRNGVWWPGFTRQQLVRVGRFDYNSSLHGGLKVNGKTVCFAYAGPDDCIGHDSYENLHHYLEKLNRYTSGEAEGLRERGASATWQAALARFVADWRIYSERAVEADGMQGFLLCFLSGFYQLAARFKLWEAGLAKGGEEQAVPARLSECLRFMEAVAQGTTNAEQAHQLPELQVETSPLRTPGVPPPAPELTEQPPGAGEARITAVLMARNEAARLRPCLEHLRGWVTEILLLDHGSTDDTVQVAKEYGARILPVPFEAPLGAGETHRGVSFDDARNLALPHVTGTHVLVVDADEWIPPELAREYVRVAGEAEGPAAVVPAYRNWFLGRWMRHCGWWPGHLHVQLARAGCLEFRGGVHRGIRIRGELRHLPPDPALAVDHFTYSSLTEYLEKLNRYTDVDAEGLLERGQSCTWQAMLAAFADEWRKFYDEGHGHGDGMHGFVLSFLSAFYRFFARAKLWDLRRERGLPLPPDPPLRSVPDWLAFIRRCVEEPAFAEQCMAPEVGDPKSEGGDRTLEGGDQRSDAGSSSQHPCSNIQHPMSNLQTLWHGPVFDSSGYADEGRHFILAMLEAGLPVALAPQQWGGDAELAPALRRQLEELRVPMGSPARVCISHTLPGLQARPPGAAVCAARTMFETDRLPDLFVARLREMDRVWVPSEFNRETFVRSGVDPDRIAVIPGAIDPAPFAADHEPWPVPNPFPGVFRFLTVFDWTLHKGWDVLLEAFAREFPGRTPEAVLLAKVWSTNGYSFSDIRRQADRHLRARLGKGLDSFPCLRLWEEALPAADLPRLYRAADAFVLPTRGEGWCRPLMQAMAAGLPSIATAWSGLTAFHDRSVGYPLRCSLRPVPEPAADEIPSYRGHCWAEPDLDHLRELLREVMNDPRRARRLGKAAQVHLLREFSRPALVSRLRPELELCAELAPVHPVPVVSLPAKAAAAGTGAVPKNTTSTTSGNRPFQLPAARLLPRRVPEAVDFREELGRPLRVRFAGDVRLLSSLALCNREFMLALLAGEDVELSWRERPSPWHTLDLASDPRLACLLDSCRRELSGPPDVTIRHHFPPCWDRPPSGRLVVMQPWEFGHLPEDWAAGAARADGVFAYSRWVRDIYLRTPSPEAPFGTPGERLHVVPLGFDPAHFQPEGDRYPLDTSRRTRFLFVGGALDRKGADLLLETYLETFSRSDDVCLVVKDMGTRTFYQGATFGPQFLAAQADPAGPEVLYLDADLAPAELGALYRACTCVVMPYRGEGFCLPPLEGMACGVPPVVTSGGPTDDFVADDSGWRLPHRRREAAALCVGHEGMFRCAGNPWQLEPDPAALRRALEEIAGNPELAVERGRKAGQRVREAWTWEQAGLDFRAALAEIVCPRPPADLVAAVPWEPAA